MSFTVQRLKEVMRGSGEWERLPPAMKESLDLIATKIGRVLHGDFNAKDTWHDIAGYATLAEERTS